MPEIKMKLDKFSLSIDLREVVADLPEEAKTEIAKLIGADEHAWRQMLEALVSDRFGTYNPTDEHGAWWSDSSTMLEVRKKLIPMLPEVARLAVEQALLERDRAKAYADQKLTQTIEQDRAWYAMKSGERYAWPDRWRRTPPEERQAFLAREAGPDLLKFAQEIANGPLEGESFETYVGKMRELARLAIDQATKEPEAFLGLKLAPPPEPEEKQEEGVL
jgi:hypothetical protein